MGNAVPVPWPLVIAIIGIFAALLGILWRDLGKRIDNISAKLDGHVGQDVLAHERITVVETQLAENTVKTKDVGDRLHRFMAETRESTRDINSLLIQKFNDLHVWITEKVIEALKK